MCLEGEEKGRGHSSWVLPYTSYTEVNTIALQLLEKKGKFLSILLESAYGTYSMMYHINRLFFM